MYDVVEPCSDSGAYRAEPTVEMKLDLEAFEKVLVEKGYGIEFSSEVILLVKDVEADVEVGVYPSGKLLFKTTDEEMIERLFDKFTSMVEDFKNSNA